VVFEVGGKSARQEVRVMTGAAEAEGEEDAEAEEVLVAAREEVWVLERVTVLVPETVTMEESDEVEEEELDLLARSLTRRTVTPAMRMRMRRMRPIWE